MSKNTEYANDSMFPLFDVKFAVKTHRRGGDPCADEGSSSGFSSLLTLASTALSFLRLIIELKAESR